MVTAMSLLLCSCSSTHYLPSIDEDEATAIYHDINEQGSLHSARLTLLEGEESIKAERIFVGKDTTYWYDTENREYNIPTSRIASVDFVDHGLGALEGAGIGFPIGALLGYMYGQFKASLCIECSSGRRQPVPINEMSQFGLTVSLVGAIPGLIAGHRTHFILHEDN